MQEVKVPHLGESIAEGTISTWLKKVGDPVQEGDVLVEIETDKVNMEIQAEHSGALKSIQAQEGQTVKVNDILATIDTTVEMSKAEPKQSVQPEEEEQPEEEPKDEQEVDEPNPIHFSPSKRRLAREKQIDVRTLNTAFRAKNIEGFNEQSNDDHAEFHTERIPMSRRRKTIAKRLVDVQQKTAMLTTFNEVDMTRIIEIRSRHKEKFKEKHGIGLGYMSFFCKAAVGALQTFPYLNAEIEDEEIVLKHYFDLGIAVSTDAGLVVPVLRHADQQSFAQIEQNIVSVAERAKQNKLNLEDLQGGTFTITNGGVFGSLLSTPILNDPQVGILGMHSIQRRPVALKDDTIVVKPMMYVALSYDHRIVDGKHAVQFLVHLKELLEDPERMLLEGL